MKRNAKKKYVYLALILLLAFIPLPATTLDINAEDPVVFVEDGGSGDGSGAGSPLGSLNTAYSMLGATGGTIVICGEKSVPSNFYPLQSTYPDHPRIVLTSVYNGVDYRTTNNAAIVIDASLYSISGATVFENLAFSLNSSTETSPLIFACNYYNVTFGSGLSFELNQSLGTPSYPLLIVGYNNPAAGQNFSGSCSVTINSGSYSYLRCGNRRSSSSTPITNVSGSVTVTVNGGSFTKADGADILTSNISVGNGMNTLSGRLFLEINGGIFESSLYAVGRAGSATSSTPGAPTSGSGYNLANSGTVEFRINGGTFYGANIGAVQCPPPGGSLSVPTSSITGKYTLTITGGTFVNHPAVKVSGASDYEAYISSALVSGLTLTGVTYSAPPLTRVYVKDGGTGSGITAATATGSLYDAVRRLENTTGTVVICGVCTITGTYSDPAHTGTITFTSVYGGVDYRSTASAKLMMANDQYARYYLGGPSIFTNITFNANSNYVIAARFHPVTFGAGCSMTVDYYLYLVGGYQGTAPAGASLSQNSSITITSGRFHFVCGSSRSDRTNSYTGNAVINISGGGTVINYLYAGTGDDGRGAGSADISITGGSVYRVYGKGQGDNGTMSGDVDVVITGGSITTALDGYNYVSEGELSLTYDPDCVTSGVTVNNFDNVTARYADAPAVGVPAVPIRDDALFAGWFTQIGQGGSYLLQHKATSVSDNVPVYAGWIVPENLTYGFYLTGTEPDLTSGAYLDFVVRIDKSIVSALDALHASNRIGQDGSIRPDLSTDKGIGYGTVLLQKYAVSGMLLKGSGTTPFSNDATVIAGNIVKGETAGYIDYVASVQIPATDYKTKIAARPYITYCDVYGTEHTYYITLRTASSVGGGYTDDLYSSALAASPYSEAAADLVEAYDATQLKTISALNTSFTENSHASETINTLELDFRSYTELTNADHFRYNNGFYPRIKKMANGNYIMFFQYGQLGQHVYYTTSSDLVNWATPQVLLQSYAIQYDGINDMRYFMTCDTCVLANGDILAISSYRANAGYQTRLDQNGIVMLRSTNNAQSWSAAQTIYVGSNWEPNIIQLESGEIQIYFTHIAPKIAIYGWNDELRSSGTAIIRSTNNGVSWTPNVTSYPYAAYRVAQQYVKTIDGVKYFTDQMPAPLQLLNGNIALAMESKNASGDYSISMAYSSNNWASALGIDETGPANRQNYMFAGAAPYLRQFISGETVLSYNTGSRMRLRTGNNTATTFAADYNVFPDTAGFWGAIEIISSHSLAAVFPRTGSTNHAIAVGQVYLNHRIDAPNTTVTVDGLTTGDWANNTDALFIGSESQAQVTFRAAHNASNLYILAERKDKYISLSDTTEIYIKCDGSSDYYKITFGVNGVTSFIRYSGGVPTTLNAGLITESVNYFGTIDLNTDTDEGYLVEMAIPKTALSLTGSGISFNAVVYNNDGSATTSDTFTNVTTADTSRWIPTDLS